VLKISKCEPRGLGTAAVASFYLPHRCSKQWKYSVDNEADDAGGIPRFYALFLHRLQL